MSDAAQGPGWWQAADGKWYPPEAAPGAAAPNPGYTGGPPAAGAPNPEQFADWGTRVVATLIDMVVVFGLAIIGFILAAILGSISTALGILVGLIVYAAAFAAGLYFAYLTGETGQSPGKRVMGIKVVNEQTGQPIGGGMGIVRQLVHALDSAICAIGYLFPLWDPKRQTFADKILTTVVLPNQPKQAFGPEVFKP